MGQFIVNAEDTRRRLFEEAEKRKMALAAQNAPPPQLSPEALEQVKTTAKVGPPMPPEVTNPEVTPEMAVTIQRGVGENAQDNTMIWRYHYMEDPRFKALSKAEQNRRSQEFFQQYVVPYAAASELPDLEPFFRPRSRISSAIREYGMAMNRPALRVAEQYQAEHPELMAASPPISRLEDPMGALIGNFIAGALPYMAAGYLAPAIIPAVPAHPLITRALKGAGTFGFVELPKVIAGEESLGEAAKNVAGGVLGFTPKSIALGATLYGGFEAALGRPGMAKFTGHPLVDTALSNAMMVGTMRVFGEGPRELGQSWRAARFQDQLSKGLDAVDARYRPKEFPPLEPTLKPIAPVITAQIPQEELDVMKQKVDDFKVHQGRKMDNILTDIVPQLEQVGAVAHAQKLSRDVEAARQAIASNDEFATLTAVQNLDASVDHASTVLGRIHPEYYTGGNSFLKLNPPAPDAKVSSTTRRAIKALQDNPPAISVERWNNLSDEVGPQGYSQRDEYYRDMATGADKAFTGDVLSTMGETYRSLPLFIRSMRAQGIIAGEPTVVNGLGLPKVSIAQHRVTKETRAGAVPADTVVQDAMRRSEFILQEIGRSGMPDNMKEELRQMVLKNIVPENPTGRVEVFPKPPAIPQTGHVSDTTAKTIIAEVAQQSQPVQLTQAQRETSVLNAPPGTQSAMLGFMGQTPAAPELQPGQGRTDIRGVLRDHFTTRYDQLKDEGYSIVDAYNRVMQEIGAIGQGPTLTETTWKDRLSKVEEKVDSWKPPEEKYGLDMKTLEDGQRVLDGMQGFAYQGMVKGETEADPLAVGRELNRTGLNGRYDRKTDAIQVEVPPSPEERVKNPNARGRYVAVSFQELKNLPGPGNYTADGDLILETRSGQYLITKDSKTGQLQATPRTGLTKKGPQKPMSLQDFRTVLFDNTGWKLEVYHPDGSAQIFDPATREVRQLTADELHQAATQPRDLPNFSPDYTGKTDPDSFNPVVVRDAPSDSLSPFPEDAEFLEAMGGATHAAEGGWSPEAIARQEHISYNIYDTRTKKLVPIIGPEAVDVNPKLGEVKYQTNLRTGRTEVVAAGPGTTIPRTLPESLDRAARLKAEYIKNVPLPPHATIAQIRDWTTGRDAYVSAQLKKGGVTLGIGAPGETPPFVSRAVERAKGSVAEAKKGVKGVMQAGPPGWATPTKGVFSYLQEGKIGQRYRLPFFEVWRTVNDYATSVRSWYQEINPEVASVVKRLKNANQDGILEYLKAQNWDQRIAVKQRYRMSPEDVRLVEPVRRVLEKAFGDQVDNWLNVHYPSYVEAQAGGEDRMTAEMATWKKKGGLNGHPTDLIEMLPNAVSSRARMSMAPAFAQIDELAKRIQDAPSDLKNYGPYLEAKAEYSLHPSESLGNHIKDLERMEMPQHIKSELLEKLFNFRGRVAWSVSSDHAAARTFVENVFTSAGVNVDKALFDKILPNYLLLSYTSTLPGRAGMILRHLCQPLMTLLPMAGPEAFGKGYTAYAEHFLGIKPNPELTEMFKAFGIDKMSGVPLEHLLAGAMDTDTLGKWGINGLRRAYHGMMKPFSWAVAQSRKIAATTGYLSMKEQGQAFLDNKITERELMRQTGLVRMEKASIREVMEPLRAGHLQDASIKFAKNLMEDTNWMYDAGNTPEIFNSRVGRFFGQFGVWPLSFMRYMYRGMRSGDALANMAFMARIAMVNYGIKKAGEDVFGVEPGHWLLTGPLGFAGGPGAGLFAAAYYATRSGFRKQIGINDLISSLHTLVPFYNMGQDIYRAATAPDLATGAKRFLGFRPYEK